MKKLIEIDYEKEFRSQDGHSMKREKEFHNYWVLRDPNGKKIGHHQYRNDLVGLYGFELEYMKLRNN